MKKFFGYGLVALMLATSCASSARASYSTDVTIPQFFNELAVSTIIDVEYSVSDKVTCRVTAPEDLKGYIKFDVRHGVLSIYVDKDNINDTNKRVKVALTAPAIKDFELSGKSTVVCTDQIDVADLDISLSGVSKMQIPSTKGREIDVELSGVSSVTISSVAANEINFETSGTSHIKVDNISGNELETSASGASGIYAGNIDVKSVECSCSGTSNIELIGRTVSAEFESSGASSISAGNLVARTGEADASGTSHIICNVAQLESLTSGIARITNK